MIEILLKALAETASSAITEFLDMDDLAEIFTAIFGLGCMAVGLDVYLFGGGL